MQMRRGLFLRPLQRENTDPRKGYAAANPLDQAHAFAQDDPREKDGQKAEHG